MGQKRSASHRKSQRQGRERDYNKCQICGSSDHVEGHHIIEYQYGGSATVDNIVALCHKHHRAVHDGKIDFLKF